MVEKYSKLEVKCVTCFGCNELENTNFKGKLKCDNYAATSCNGLDMCRKILGGKQITIGGRK